MENDQRLTPLPGARTIQPNTHIDYSSGGNYAATYEDTLDNRRSLRQYFQIVYKRLPIIVAITILATVAAAIYSYRQPTQYQSATSIIIEPKKPPQSKQAVVTVNNGDDERYYRTQLEILKSPDLMKRVVISLGVHRDPNLLAEQNRGLIASLRSLFSGEQKPVENPNAVPVISDTTVDPENKAKVVLTVEEEARAATYSYLFQVNVMPRNQTSIVDVAVSGTKPELIPKVADKIAQLFIQENEEREQSTNKQALLELEESIVGLRKSIEQQQSEYIAEVMKSSLGLGDKQGEVRAGNLEGLLTSWRKAQEETGQIEARLNSVVRARGVNILDVLPDSPGLQGKVTDHRKRVSEHEARVTALETKIGEAKEKKKQLLATKTESHRDVLAMSAQITELEAQRKELAEIVGKKIDDEGKQLERNATSGAIEGLRAQLSAAQQREARQKAAFDNAAAQANVEGASETRQTTLRQALTANQTLLDSYTQRQKEQELTLAIDRPNNIKQQAPAPPASATGPARGRNIMVALLLSFAAGIGLAFLLDFLDDSVRTSDDISRHLGLPTLALIPHSADTDKRKQLSGRGGGAAAAANSHSLITLDERTSPMAEAYRHLRTSLLFSSAGKPPQTILITSSQPSEGKTTTAINTAITLAQGDADVVIIDCDLRRPRLHSHFGLENTRGLTNYLSGDRDTEGLIRAYPDQPRLKVITSGPIPPNPAELLSSNEMRNLLTFLSGKFKHIVIDSPPAISFTDASILSTLVDGVVLVAMANKSSLHLMKQFKHRISAIGARIYGVVLNGIKPNSTEYYYYGSGYYNYYSRPDDDSTPYMDDEK